jgi:hypothetical protein
LFILEVTFCGIAYGHRDRADVNTAKNILRRRNTAPLPVWRSRRLLEAGPDQATHTPLGNPQH